MTAAQLLGEMETRCVRITLNGDRLKIDAPVRVLTDDDRQAIREHKAELLALLRSKTTEHPRIGTFARPRVVRGTRALTDCPWSTCGRPLRAHGHNLYECSTCTTWFEFLPPEDLGVYVGDLANDLDRSDVAEWVM